MKDSIDELSQLYGRLDMIEGLIGVKIPMDMEGDAIDLFRGFSDTTLKRGKAKKLEKFLKSKKVEKFLFDINNK